MQGHHDGPRHPAVDGRVVPFADLLHVIAGVDLDEIFADRSFKLKQQFSLAAGVQRRQVLLDAKRKLETLRGHLEGEGRDPADFGIEAWLRMDSAEPDKWAAAAAGWRALGADLVTLYPNYPIDRFDGLIDTLRRFKEAVAS